MRRMWVWDQTTLSFAGAELAELRAEARAAYHAGGTAVSDARGRGGREEKKKMKKTPTHWIATTAVNAGGCGCPEPPILRRASANRDSDSIAKLAGCFIRAVSWKSGRFPSTCIWKKTCTTTQTHRV